MIKSVNIASQSAGNLSQNWTALWSPPSQATTSLCDEINDKAVVVHVFFSQNRNLEDLSEFQQLAESAKVEISQLITTTRSVPQAKYFVGEGKAQEIAQAVEIHNANVVLVNHSLTPAQIHNISSLINIVII